MKTKANKLLHEYYLTKKQDLLTDILFELGNIELWVPINLHMDDDDEKTFIHAQEGDVVTLSNDMYLRPDFLQSGQDLFFPIFVSKDDAPEDYRASFSWLNITLNQAADFTLKMENLSGIVVNAFTDPFVISREFLEYRSQKMNSYKISKGEEISFAPLSNDEEAVALMSAIREFANKELAFLIREIYAVDLIRNEQKSYLIIVDTDSQNLEELFGKMNIYLHKGGRLHYPIDFCRCSNSIKSDMEQNGIKPVWNSEMRYSS